MIQFNSFLEFFCQIHCQDEQLKFAKSLSFVRATLPTCQLVVWIRLSSSQVTINNISGSFLIQLSQCFNIEDCLGIYWNSSSRVWFLLLNNRQGFREENCNITSSKEGWNNSLYISWERWNDQTNPLRCNLTLFNQNGLQGSNVFYRHSSGYKLNFSDAATYCNSIRGKLVEIESDVERLRIASFNNIFSWSGEFAFYTFK
jgi:hypothetical protein